MRAQGNYERCCEVLEVPPGASMAEIEQSFRELIKVWHPDRFTDNPALQIRATRKTSEITRAFAWLRRHHAFQQGRTPAESTPERVLNALRQALVLFLDRNPATPPESVQRAVRALLIEVATRSQPERVHPFRWLRNLAPRRLGRVIVERPRAVLAWTALILVLLFFGGR
jgi:hypothetical protein